MAAMNAINADVVAVRAARRATSSGRRASCVVRGDASEGQTQAKATVYFTNKAGQRVAATDEEYAAAVAAGDVYKASVVTGVPAPLQGASSNGVPLEQAMAFAGPAPELINGRAAMIAVSAALAAEATSHETVLKQLSEQPTGVVLAAVLIAVGSLVPILDGKQDTKSPLSFMTASAEMVNARAAMMGFVALICSEALLGHSLL